MLVYLLEVKDAKDKEVVADEGIQIFTKYMGRINLCSPHTHNHVEYFQMKELSTTLTRFRWASNFVRNITCFACLNIVIEKVNK